MQSQNISSQQAAWLDKWAKESWSINDSGAIDVKGRVYIEDAQLRELPVVFGSVEGIFMCRCPRLVSVAGMPTSCQQFIFDKCLFPAHYYLGAI